GEQQDSFSYSKEILFLTERGETGTSKLPSIISSASKKIISQHRELTVSFHENFQLFLATKLPDLELGEIHLENLKLAAEMHRQTEEQSVVGAVSDSVDENVHCLQHQHANVMVQW
ncbi:unnamed protein product, partial [Heterotrigona itama]